MADIGFFQQAELFVDVAQYPGRTPPVIDSADIRAASEPSLTRLCAALGLPFTSRMLHWPTGPKPRDGVWVPHWFGEDHASTGFDAGEGPLPDLPVADQHLARATLPHDERLAACRLPA